MSNNNPPVSRHVYARQLTAWLPPAPANHIPCPEAPPGPGKLLGLAKTWKEAAGPLRELARRYGPLATWFYFLLWVYERHRNADTLAERTAARAAFYVALVATGHVAGNVLRYAAWIIT